MGYKITISRSAEKELDRLHPVVYNRIIKKLLSLEDNPRPRGIKKLSGFEEYRLRVGDYRILFTIDDHHHIVNVVAVGHRREIYG